MARWSILRKKTVKEKHEDLLVFGYACKLFRDDEKALYIDQGKHLIPWMGQESLKIDRYDCRGALSELLPYEATYEDYDAKRWLGLNESERKIEIMCDEERYYALKNNEEELEMYKEEELKRLHQKGSEVQYNYDVPLNPESLQEVPEKVEPDDEPFSIPIELNLPSDIEVPKTVKENARIEKTALFVSKQGPQMEILIKTKQSDNPQFNFMNKDNPLYLYYKHLLAAIKSGEYKVQSQATNTDGTADESCNIDEQDRYNEPHYLHPSLLATSLQQQRAPAPSTLPTVIYRPSADCKYSQLVNRIQGAANQSTGSPPPPLPPLPQQTQGSAELPTQTQLTYEQQQQYYQQYYYASQYYEYYKQMIAAQHQHFQGTQTANKDGVVQPPFVPNDFMPSHSHHQPATSGYTQYLQPNPYAQIVSNLSQTTKDFQTDSSANGTQGDISKAPILYTPGQNIEPTAPPPLPAVTTPILVQQQSTVVPTPSPTVPPKPTTTEKAPVFKKSLLALVEYGSGTDDEEEEEEDEKKNEDFKVPPNETQQIIDKMASYVVKNGKDFENIVRSKGDTRFEFLQENHEHHPYYMLKIKEYTEQQQQQTDPGTQNGDTKDHDELKNGLASKLKESKKLITPVSFSIKKPKDEGQKEIKSALLMEESDDDREESTIVAPTAPPAPSEQGATCEGVDQESPGSLENKMADADDLILEMIDLTSDLEERKESKRAEDRKKDKITAAVREKLALQLERKKKAAAFLKLKSAEGGSRHEARASEDKHSSATKKSESSKSKTEQNNTHKTEESESEEGEIRKHRKSSKKKKSHKRKRSRSRHRSKSRHKKEHKKSKKKRKRSDSYSSRSSVSS